MLDYSTWRDLVTAYLVAWAKRSGFRVEVCDSKSTRSRYLVCKNGFKVCKVFARISDHKSRVRTDAKGWFNVWPSGESKLERWPCLLAERALAACALATPQGRRQ